MLTAVSGPLAAAQSSSAVSGKSSKPSKDDKGLFAELMAALAGVAALLAAPGQQGVTADSGGSVTTGTSPAMPDVAVDPRGLMTGSPAAGDGGQGPDQGVAGSPPATGVPTVSATTAAGVLSAATLPSGAAQTKSLPAAGQAADAGATAPEASPGGLPGSPVSPAGPGVPIAEVSPAAAVLPSASTAVSAQTGSSQQPGVTAPAGPVSGTVQGGFPPFQAMTSQGTSQAATQPAVAAQVTPAPQPPSVGTAQAAVPAAVQATVQATVPTAVRESSPGAGTSQGVIQGTVNSQVAGLSSGYKAGGDAFQSASDGGSGSSGGNGRTGAENTVNPAANLFPAYQTIPEAVTASVANLPQAVARTIENYVSQGGRLPAQLELHLDPPALGKLTIHLALDAGTLSVAFVTASTHAHDAVAAGLPQMRNLLGQLGVALGQAHVFVSSGGGGTGGGHSRGSPAGWGAANAGPGFPAGSDEQGIPTSSGTSLVNILV